MRKRKYKCHSYDVTVKMLIKRERVLVIGGIGWTRRYRDAIRQPTQLFAIRLANKQK